MFHDILIAAFAIAIVAYVWYVIGFVFCRIGAIDLFTKFSIVNRRVREIVFTLIALTLVPICALYLIVLKSCDDSDNN